MIMDNLDPEYLVGLKIDDLLEVSKRLKILGLDIKDILEFLDRREVVILGEKERKIKHLQYQLRKIKDFVGEIE